MRYHRPAASAPRQRREEGEKLLSFAFPSFFSLFLLFFLFLLLLLLLFPSFSSEVDSLLLPLATGIPFQTKRDPVSVVVCRPKTVRPQLLTSPKEV